MSHEQAKASLEAGEPAELICATCPWDRLCVEPPTISAQEISRKLDEAIAKDTNRDPGHTGMPVTSLLTAITWAGKDTAGKLCPVFALRLSGPDGRAVADGLRSTMRAWSDAA